MSWSARSLKSLRLSPDDPAAPGASAWDAGAGRGWRCAFAALLAARSARSAARRACSAASSAAAPTVITAASEARAVASASSIRPSSSPSEGGVISSGSNQSWVLSRSRPAIAVDCRAGAGGKRGDPPRGPVD